MSDENEINWQAIGEKLRAPFDPADVDFRVQGRVNEQTGKGQVVAYIDARSVQDRLDEVVGAGNWSFDWEPVVIDKGDVQVAKGTLTILGVSKSDVGTASNFEASLGAVSHCFKRAAVHFGIGRYLYGVSSMWVAVEKGGRIADETLRSLRARLPRPAGGAPPTQSAFVARPPVIHPAVDESAAKEQRKFATPDQWTRLRKACELLNIEPPEAPLEYDRAENLLHEYMETWKRLSAQRQREGATR
jgi:hypothetical protein